MAPAAKAQNAPQPSSATAAAKADGKAFGREQAAAAQGAATARPDANRIPGFGSNPAEARHFDDPAGMEREAAAQAASHSGYRTMRDSMDRRARFAPQDLDAVIARSKHINTDPLAFTSGMSVSGSHGRCVPLPPGSASSARYMATCNVGYAVSEERRSCAIPLRVAVETQPRYIYWCSEYGMGGQESCARFEAAGCERTIQTEIPCQTWPDAGGPRFCEEPGEPVSVMSCSAPVTGSDLKEIIATLATTSSRDESECEAFASDPGCSQTSEACTDSDPLTRIIDGVAVTRPCWAWERQYACAQYAEAQDCQTLGATPGCNLVGEECLSGEPCRTWERVYDCPLPDQPGSPNQFICDADVYCIDGSCETITREANDEFKDAVVALNAMDQARREFDPDSLTLFKGTRATCSSKVFGVLNCCKGKGFALVPGIQLLVSLGCSREEMLLHERDAQGLCAYVGTYCSDSFLGVCLTKKKAYCCFESKLSRILQEQGRKQLNKPWAKPRDEQCRGFTLDEFARLDLSQMDFSEVYAEFTEAARLPDELAVADDLQQKIEDFYTNATR
ncbi:conjugal transfer protein TraN [Porphyrobacter sp. HT-58-2]|uniref:conjugal transfer protein TraN n=1 Tax=Porphyrobacter sp. HT-58-2 TaxID=2023229 RepID=UPI000CDBB837|nr:conjugal transfer protein TraN [Porphyrobacter sp. HT-58-2]